MDAGNTNPVPNHLETPLVDREPIEIEIAENTFPRGMSIRETRIQCPITSKPHWSTGNQWKSRSLKTPSSRVCGCGKHESSAQSPRNPIGRPGTNRNRDRRKHLPQGHVDTGNTNPVPNHLETPLVDQEPMEIEIAENTFPRGMSMRETRIQCPITSKPHWSTRNQWKPRSPEKSVFKRGLQRKVRL